MPAQDLPPSARRYAAAQRRESGAAVSAVRRLWAQMNGATDFDAAYLRIEPSLLAVVTGAQRRMAEQALTFVPNVLADTGQSDAIAPAARAVVGPLVGVDGSGRSVASLMYGAVTDAKASVGAGISPAVALHRASSWLTTATATTLSDTGRQSEALGIGVRPVVTGYVRMLTPPSCSRCVILAGKRVKSETAFARHPGCDCRHIPASESVANDLTVSPHDYFDQLTTEQQDATFGKAGAEAIRAGADPGQVVNARRGMSVSQVGGRNVLVTSEGMTRRGVAYKRLSTARSARTDVKVAGQRYARSRVIRPMPETIAEVATDHDDYLRLLHTFGYVL